MTKWGLSQQPKIGLTLKNQCNAPYQQSKTKAKQSSLKMLKKNLTKSKIHSWLKTLSHQGIKGNIPLTKGIYSSTADVKCNSIRQNALFLN